MTTYDGPATIRQGDEEIQVACSYTYRPATRTGLGEWFGRFTGATGPLEPREADLVLPGEQPVRIVITNLDGRIRRSGLFQGTGPAPA